MIFWFISNNKLNAKRSLFRCEGERAVGGRITKSEARGRMNMDLGEEEVVKEGLGKIGKQIIYNQIVMYYL